MNYFIEAQEVLENLESTVEAFEELKESCRDEQIQQEQPETTPARTTNLPSSQPSLTQITKKLKHWLHILVLISTLITWASGLIQKVCEIVTALLNFLE